MQSLLFQPAKHVYSHQSLETLTKDSPVEGVMTLTFASLTEDREMVENQKPEDLAFRPADGSAYYG